LLACGGSAPAAAKEYVFALVPKNMNNPFFDQARDGCMKATKENAGKFRCEYIGPGEHGGGEEQVQVVNDLIARKVDGIAVSPSNAAAMGRALEKAKAAGIPVLTWDSDLLEKDKALRVAYVGTKNYDIGVNLAKIAQTIKPQGGTICIQSGGAAASNHNERMQGIRDTLSGKKSDKAPARSWPAPTAGPRPTAARSTPTTTSRARCSRWRTRSPSTRTWTRSSRPAASRSSSRRPTSASPRSTRPGSTTSRWP
jgi:ribose transport system substrate-binding protein